MSQTLSKKKVTNKNGKNTNHKSKILKVIEINNEIPDTSLKTPIEIPRTKLSTIKETDEKLLKSTNTGVRTKLMNGIKIKMNNVSTSNEKKDEEVESTKYVTVLQEEIDINVFNNTVDEMKPNPLVPEVVLSPYVCTTRGKKWIPPPCIPPKLSELRGKYEDNNIADLYMYL